MITQERKELPAITLRHERRRRLIYLLLLVAAVLLLPSICFRLINGPAYKQRSDEVVIREAGARFLGSPQPVAQEARTDLDFAWLSESAYQRIPNSKERDSNSCQNPDTILGNAGWSRWPNFPDETLLENISRSHLRVEVWKNQSLAAVAVAFGGTVFKSGKDWKSNLRWFIPRHNDEYTEIVSEFGPAFVREFVQRKQEPEWDFLNHAKIYATGHSLGGPDLRTWGNPGSCPITGKLCLPRKCSQPKDSPDKVQPVFQVSDRWALDDRARMQVD